MIVGIKTDKKWVKSISEVPILGGIFIFIIIFIVPVVCSFLCQALISGLHNEVDFTKALLVLLPSWNLILWFFKIRLYVFFLPAWAVLGSIALIKIIRMVLE